MPGPLNSFEERQRYAELLREAFARHLRNLTERVRNGDLTVIEWQLTMRDELRQMYVQMTFAGAGGKRTGITQADLDRLDSMLAEQYQYLDAFARQMQAAWDNPADPFWGKASDRTSMYAMSSYQAFWAQAVPVELPAYPGDGSTFCLTKCQCRWRIEYQWRRRFLRRPVVEAVLATWELGAAEHCDDCVARSQTWNPLRIAVSSDFVPDELFKWLKDVKMFLDKNEIEVEVVQKVS